MGNESERIAVLEERCRGIEAQLAQSWIKLDQAHASSLRNSMMLKVVAFVLVSLLGLSEFVI